MQLELVKLPKRNEVRLDKQKGIFLNGKDNAYPQRVERIINASVSAKMWCAMLKKFIIGGGFEDEALNQVVVSTDVLGDTTLYRFLSQCASTVSRQNGVFAQVGYDANLKIFNVKHIPFRDCRIGRDDSFGYSGKIHVSTDWEKTLPVKEKEKVIDTFNPKEEVVKAQFKKGYMGQIAHLFLDDEYVYPLSVIDPSLEDADTEAQISAFKNGELRGGFFAKYIVYHTAFQTKEQALDFKAKLQKFQGGEHEGSMLLAEAVFDAETGNPMQSLNFKLEKIEQNINDKIFESYETSVANNIRKSLLAIPQILIEWEGGKLSAPSGTLLNEAIGFYNSQTEDIRTALSQWMTTIFRHSANPQLAQANFTIKKLNYGTLDAGRTAGDKTAEQQ